MRPIRIELEGFSAFRNPTCVDFTDADLFAFVGPTGSGKSSVIDGIIFALYGSVPRYGSERLVHPVISQGKPEARIRLDFEVGGVAHTAVRVVRRTKTGATTKEARLERGDEVLAADAASVTEAVVALLGLELEQFTKCVVLPQGAFAALLHDTTSRRQDLLVKLLDLGVYEQVAQAARRRVQAADQRLAVLGEQLAALAHATDQAVADVERRIDLVAGVLAQIDAAAPELAALDEERRDVERDATDVGEAQARVAGIAVPDDVATVAARVRDATAAARAAAEAEVRAASQVEEAVAARAELGDAERIRSSLDRHERIAELDERIAKGQALIAEREAALAALRRTRDQAAEAAEAAARAYEVARVGDAAADLARHLHVGDDCPVCGHEVTTVPERAGGEVEAAERAHRGAGDAARRAEQEQAAAERELAGFQATLDDRLGERVKAVAALGDAPGPDELRSTLAAVAAADQRVDAARAADRRARAATAAARREADEAARSEAAARETYARSRDAVASQDPPPPSTDLAADWEALAQWASARHRRLASRAEELVAARKQLEQRRAQLVDELTRAARSAKIPVTDPSRLRDACVTARAEARAAHDRLVEERDRAAALGAESETVTTDRAVHDLLATELGPRRFEAWLLDEALTSLVAGASERLHQLSSGRYALAVDDKKQFEVVDHANADERRLARTLSGGETFLASLALALALAERVSELSATGQRSLEAIFLDEGFGTLDPETLDVVASAIEELGASGRMVGVVSHVRELADRVPVRFEVQRGPDTSTVQRVDA